MKKKAEIESQIFIYIFALIVISLILVFGIKAINSFRKDTEKISSVNFQVDMKSLIANIASQYGSIEIADISLPKDYRKVCFVDDMTTASETAAYPLIKDALSTSDNIFLIKAQSDIESFKLDTPIQVDNNGAHFLCVDNINGKIRFTIEGKARYAEISP